MDTMSLLSIIDSSDSMSLGSECFTNIVHSIRHTQKVCEMWSVLKQNVQLGTKSDNFTRVISLFTDIDPKYEQTILSTLISYLNLTNTQPSHPHPDSLASLFPHSKLERLVSDYITALSCILLSHLQSVFGRVMFDDLRAETQPRQRITLLESTETLHQSHLVTTTTNPIQPSKLLKMIPEPSTLYSHDALTSTLSSKLFDSPYLALFIRIISLGDSNANVALQFLLDLSLDKQFLVQITSPDESRSRIIPYPVPFAAFVARLCLESSFCYSLLSSTSNPIIGPLSLRMISTSLSSINSELLSPLLQPIFPTAQLFLCNTIDPSRLFSETLIDEYPTSFWINLFRFPFHSNNIIKKLLNEKVKQVDFQASSTIFSSDIAVLLDQLRQSERKPLKFIKKSLDKAVNHLFESEDISVPEEIEMETRNIWAKGLLEMDRIFTESQANPEEARVVRCSEYLLASILPYLTHSSKSVRAFSYAVLSFFLFHPLCFVDPMTGAPLALSSYPAHWSLPFSYSELNGCFMFGPVTLLALAHRLQTERTPINHVILVVKPFTPPFSRSSRLNQFFDLSEAALQSCLSLLDSFQIQSANYKTQSIVMLPAELPHLSMVSDIFRRNMTQFMDLLQTIRKKTKIHGIDNQDTLLTVSQNVIRSLTAMRHLLSHNIATHTALLTALSIRLYAISPPASCCELAAEMWIKLTELSVELRSVCAPVSTLSTILSLLQNELVDFLVFFLDSISELIWMTSQNRETLSEDFQISSLVNFLSILLVYFKAKLAESPFRPNSAASSFSFSIPLFASWLSTIRILEMCWGTLFNDEESEKPSTLLLILLSDLSKDDSYLIKQFLSNSIQIDQPLFGSPHLSSMLASLSGNFSSNLSPLLGLLFSSYQLCDLNRYGVLSSSLSSVLTTEFSMQFYEDHSFFPNRADLWGTSLDVDRKPSVPCPLITSLNTSGSNLSTPLALVSMKQILTEQHDTVLTADVSIRSPWLAFPLVARAESLGTPYFETDPISPPFSSASVPSSMLSPYLPDPSFPFTNDLLLLGITRHVAGDFAPPSLPFVSPSRIQTMILLCLEIILQIVSEATQPHDIQFAENGVEDVTNETFSVELTKSSFQVLIGNISQSTKQAFNRIFPSLVQVLMECAVPNPIRMTEENENQDNCYENQRLQINQTNARWVQQLILFSSSKQPLPSSALLQNEISAHLHVHSNPSFISMAYLDDNPITLPPDEFLSGMLDESENPPSNKPFQFLKELPPRHPSYCESESLAILSTLLLKHHSLFCQLLSSHDTSESPFRKELLLCFREYLLAYHDEVEEEVADEPLSPDQDTSGIFITEPLSDDQQPLPSQMKMTPSKSSFTPWLMWVLEEIILRGDEECPFLPPFFSPVGFVRYESLDTISGFRSNTKPNQSHQSWNLCTMHGSCSPDNEYFNDQSLQLAPTSLTPFGSTINDWGFLQWGWRLAWLGIKCLHTIIHNDENNSKAYFCDCFDCEHPSLVSPDRCPTIQTFNILVGQASFLLDKWSHHDFSAKSNPFCNSCWDALLESLRTVSFLPHVLLHQNRSELSSTKPVDENSSPIKPLIFEGFTRTDLELEDDLQFSVEKPKRETSNLKFQFLNRILKHTKISEDDDPIPTFFSLLGMIFPSISAQSSLISIQPHRLLDWHGNGTIVPLNLDASGFDTSEIWIVSPFVHSLIQILFDLSCSSDPVILSQFVTSFREDGILPVFQSFTTWTYRILKPQMNSLSFGRTTLPLLFLHSRALTILDCLSRVDSSQDFFTSPSVELVLFLLHTLKEHLSLLNHQLEETDTFDEDEFSRIQSLSNVSVFSVLRILLRLVISSPSLVTPLILTLPPKSAGNDKTMPVLPLPNILNFMMNQSHPLPLRLLAAELLSVSISTLPLSDPSLSVNSGTRTPFLSKEGHLANGLDSAGHVIFLNRSSEFNQFVEESALDGLDSSCSEMTVGEAIQYAFMTFFLPPPKPTEVTEGIKSPSKPPQTRFSNETPTKSATPFVSPFSDLQTSPLRTTPATTRVSHSVTPTTIRIGREALSPSRQVHHRSQSGSPSPRNKRTLDQPQEKILTSLEPFLTLGFSPSSMLLLALRELSLRSELAQRSFRRNDNNSSLFILGTINVFLDDLSGASPKRFTEVLPVLLSALLLLHVVIPQMDTEPGFEDFSTFLFDESIFDVIGRSLNLFIHQFHNYCSNPSLFPPTKLLSSSLFAHLQNQLTQPTSGSLMEDEPPIIHPFVQTELVVEISRLFWNDSFFTAPVDPFESTEVDDDSNTPQNVLSFVITYILTIQNAILRLTPALQILFSQSSLFVIIHHIALVIFGALFKESHSVAPSPTTSDSGLLQTISILFSNPVDIVRHSKRQFNQLSLIDRGRNVPLKIHRTKLVLLALQIVLKHDNAHLAISRIESGHGEDCLIRLTPSNHSPPPFLTQSMFRSDGSLLEVIYMFTEKILSSVDDAYSRRRMKPTLSRNPITPIGTPQPTSTNNLNDTKVKAKQRKLDSTFASTQRTLERTKVSLAGTARKGVGVRSTIIPQPEKVLDESIDISVYQTIVVFFTAPILASLSVSNRGRTFINSQHDHHHLLLHSLQSSSQPLLLFFRNMLFSKDVRNRLQNQKDLLVLFLLLCRGETLSTRLSQNICISGLKRFLHENESGRALLKRQEYRQLVIDLDDSLSLADYLS
ncbi:hypothetical protein BLNAU_3811 [Blattamonas nauphoetae]|uniref:Uncharacterized protein n=1 Tax=Blattamonas nauphoetae TaxID=2049346 RepID=A0ABQ9YCC1_9EUKA|nr:hypothetical protein BLNAU_3811 [Blattamonas nauphoetae]